MQPKFYHLLLQYLASGKRGTVQELASILQCSDRSIRRALTIASNEGKIQYEIVRKKRVYRYKGEVVPQNKFSFTDEQLYALLVASEACLHPFTQTPIGQNLGEAFRILLQNNENWAYDEGIERKYWYFDSFKKSHQDSHIFKTLVTALQERRYVHPFVYRNSNNEIKTHHLLPLGLVFTKGSWIFVGKLAEKGHVMNLNVSRIQEAHLAETIYMDESIDLNERFGKGMFNEEDEVIRIRVNPADSHRFEENIYHRTQQIEGFDAEGWMVVSFESWSFREATSFFLSWKNLIQVTEPPELVAQMKAYLQQMMALYD